MTRIIALFFLLFSLAANAEQILVQPRKGADPKKLEADIAAIKGKRVGHIKQIDVHVIALPAGANAKGVVEMLRHNPNYRFVEVDEKMPHALVTNDPMLTSAWQNYNVNALAAWDSATGAGVTVAICDTGVDNDHPDLVAAFVPGWATADENADTNDYYGHGTLVAGVAAAIGNNGTGAAGVAMASKIMPFRITTGAENYASFSNMAQCITMAADRGARVANLSFGSACTSATVQAAGDYIRSRGGVLVSAAGNNNAEITFVTESSVCVAAVDGYDNKASFSNWGAGIDVAAPGTGVYGTANGGGYRTGSGTSFAAPVVAGVYGLVFSANPGLSPSQADQIIFSTAKDIGATGKDNVYGWGRVDAAAAVLAARDPAPGPDTTDPVVRFSTPSNGSTVRGLVAIDVIATDNVGVTRVLIAANGSLLVDDSSSPYSYVWNTTSFPDGTVTLEAIAFDAAGNAGRVSISVIVDNVCEPRGKSGKCR